MITMGPEIGIGLSLVHLRRGSGLNIEALDFDLWDEFVTDDAAPVTSPRTSEPGGETVTLVQTDGEYAISSHQMSGPVQSTANWGDQGFYGPAVTRAFGVALIHRVNITTFGRTLVAKFHESASAGYGASGPGFYRAAGTGWRATDNGTIPILNLADAFSRLFTTVLRATGAVYLMDERIVFVGTGNSTATLYPQHSAHSVAATHEFFRALQLPAPWDAESTIALHVDPTPTADDTADVEQDGFMVFKWTPGSSEVLDIMFRRTDDDNTMILRCDQANGWIRVYRKVGGSETQVDSQSQTWTVSTEYTIRLRWYGRNIDSWVNDTIKNSTLTQGFNITETGVKVTGFASGADWSVWPGALSGTAYNKWKQASQPATTYQPRQTISVPDGATISTYIAQMNPGDILSLASGGSYTLSASEQGFGTLPSGHALRKTRVNGNGATITGGARGIGIADKLHLEFNDLRLEDGTDGAFLATDCRYCTFNNVYGDTNGVGAQFDVFRYNRCRDMTFNNCEAGPSTGGGVLDGFEAYGECFDITFNNCSAHGVVHGFEVWSGSSPVGVNARITFNGCNSYDNDVGFSAEGGAQALNHPGIVCNNCTVSNNSEYGYQGVDSATLTIYGHDGGSTNGNVTIAS